MNSFLTRWFMNFKLEVNLEEAERLQSPTINLRSHSLSECPEFSHLLSKEYLESITCLMLQHNQLVNFSRTSCHCLENLKALMLDYNRLVDLPFDFRQMKNLSILNVSHNNFSGPHFFLVICQISTLKVLWANKTGIREIPPEIQSLRNLRTLGLRRNSITKLPSEFFRLINLQWLTLAGNEIEEIPFEVERFHHLVHLNLQRNRIMRLPITFNHLEKLQFLFLQYNFLVVNEGLIGFIGSLPRLNTCWIQGNLMDPSNPNGEPVDRINRPNNTSSGMTPMTPWSATVSPPDSQRDPPSQQSHNNIEQDQVGSQLSQPNSSSHDIHDRPTQLAPFVSEIEPQKHDRRLSDPEPSVVSTLDLETVFRTNNSQFSVSMPPTDAYHTETSVESTRHAQETGGEETLENRFRNGFVDSTPQVLRSSVSRQCASPYNIVFVSSERLTTSTGNGEELIREQIPSGNNNSVPDQNCNTERYPCARRYRQFRTEQWVLNLREQSEQEQTNQENKKMLHEGDVNIVQLEEEVQDEVPEIIERIREKVDDIISDAARQISLRGGYSIPFPAQKSTMYIISEGFQEETEVGSATLIVRKAESNVDIRASFPIQNCDGNNTVVVGESTILDVGVTSMSGSNGIQPTVSGETHAMILSTNSATDAAAATINESFIALHPFSSTLDLVDIESNYDPSEWEYSAPSSAIDDQDIAPKFGASQEIGQLQLYDNDDDVFPALTDEEALNILPTIFI